MRFDISLELSIFSLILVELISSSWTGSVSLTTLPVIRLYAALRAEMSSVPDSAVSLLNTMWFIEWIEFSTGSSEYDDALIITSLPATM